jgi:DNA polymerase elongation subunit (family B)
VLTADIETRPIKAYTFQVWQTNIAETHMTEPCEIISIAWKWLDEKKPQVRDVNTDGKESMLRDFWSALDEADAIVTFNGDKFDLRHLRREFAQYKLEQPRRIASIDMRKIIKAQFDLPFYRLDYCAGFFLGEHKIDTGGFGLWKAYMAKDPKATKAMRKYNQHDVVITEKLYKHLRGWMPNHPNIAPFEAEFEDSEKPCGTCGSGAREQYNIRPRRTRHYAIQQLACKDCGNIYDGKRKKI